MGSLILDKVRFSQILILAGLFMAVYTKGSIGGILPFIGSIGLYGWFQYLDKDKATSNAQLLNDVAQLKSDVDKLKFNEGIKSYQVRV